MEPNNDKSSSELHLEAQRYQGKAVGILILRLWPKAVKVAYNVLYDKSLTEDIAQEAVSTYHEKYLTPGGEKFDEPVGSPEGLIAKIARGKALNANRKKRAVAVPLEELDLLSSGVTISPPRQDKRLLFLLECEAKLPPNLRSLVKSYYDLGFSLDEIGKDLCISEKMVELRLALVRDLLRKCIQKSMWNETA